MKKLSLFALIWMVGCGGSSDKTMSTNKTPKKVQVTKIKTATATKTTTEKSMEQGDAKLILKSVDPMKKIQTIKLVRELTNLGLKDAKDLVDKAIKEPVTILENISSKKGKELKKRFEEVGAKAEVEEKKKDKKKKKKDKKKKDKKKKKK